MTGPEHYAEAERQREHARQQAEQGNWDEATLTLKFAQVDATLALAAATALASRERDGDHDGDGMDPRDRHAWEHAAGGAS